MEQMEITPVPLDNDNNGSMIVDSNSLTTNEKNYLFKPSSDAISVQSENDTSIKGTTLGTKKEKDSSVPCQSEKLLEIFENVHLSNDMPSGETVGRNAASNTENSSKGNETVINENVGSCMTNFHISDEISPTKCVSESAIECPAESSSKTIHYAVSNDASMSFALACVSENSVAAIHFSNNTQTSMDEASKIVCEKPADQSCKSETECDLNKSDVRKECEVSGNLFQFDSLQKQTSEIKERVMGFLTKYSNTDEATCSSQSSVQNYSQDCIQEKQFQVMNEKSATETVWGEQCESLKFKKMPNDVTIQNQMELGLANSQSPKLHFASVSKSMVPESFLQTSSVGLITGNTSVQAKDEINQQIYYTTFVSHVPLQNKLTFSESNNEQHLSTSKGNETSCEKVCSLRTSNNVMESHDAENTTESNANLFQPNSEIALNNFEMEMSQNCQVFSTKSNLQPTSAYNTPIKNTKDLRQQNEMNASNLLFENQSPYINNDFVNKIQRSSNQKNITSAPLVNTECRNQVTWTFQRGANTDPVNSWLSWGRISGEPHTTPSINSPILSCKTSNEPPSSKYNPFSNSLLVSNVWTDNSESIVWPAMNISKSRRTKSSDAMICNVPNPFNNGGTAYSIHTNSKSRKNDSSSLGKPGEMDRTNLSNFNISDCGISSDMHFTTQNNINKNSQSIFVNCLGKSTCSANRETLQTDYKCFEEPFASNLNKGNMENPFFRKSPIENIGLFKSPTKTVVSEVENSAFKHVSSSLFPFKREKGGEYSENGDRPKILRPTASNDSFGFSPGVKGKQDQITCTSTEFAFNSLCTRQSSVPTNKEVMSFEQTSNDEINEQTLFGSSERAPLEVNSNSLFQFTFTPEKSKALCGGRVTLPRSTRKSIKTIKQFEKVPLKGLKSDNTSDVTGKGTEDTSFKPVYGSDVKFEKGIYKNVIVRYQNIVFMDDYSHVSSEELRSQFYAKTVISGPFKFGATVNSCENHSKENCSKKTQSQQVQTDEQHTSKNPDLAAIWRVLECPVCLDVVLPPIYQCEQGHHACATCWTRVLTCPLCKRPQSYTRNYMAEALVEQVPLPCRYHIEGCKETVQHNNKVSHEETCSYRMYQCPVPSCNQALSYQNMCKHFKKHHKNILHHEGHSVGKGEKFCDVLYKEALLSSLIHAFDITKWGLFFLREVAVGCSTAFFVQVMPATSDQAVYFYHLEVCDHHDCRKECYKGRVFPMCKPSQEIIRQEEYLCLSELILKTVKKTTPLKIVVTIWQLKPAFTLST